MYTSHAMYIDVAMFSFRVCFIRLVTFTPLSVFSRSREREGGRVGGREGGRRGEGVDDER